MAVNPLVSVIITNFNYARFLEHAIESAIAQSYGPVEIIVVDDGSTDDSAAIIRGYGDRVIPVFKQNGGQASAFNAGLARSHGEIVIFLDADDVLLPDIVHRVTRAFAANPTAAKVHYRMEMIDAEGQRLGVLMPEPRLSLPDGDLRERYLSFPDDVTRMATSGNAFPAWVLRQVSPLPQRADKHGADWYLTAVTPFFGPVVSLEHVGALYRVHGSNFFHSSVLDLRQTRRAISVMQDVHSWIKTVADRLGFGDFPGDPNDVLSVAFLGDRMVSLKLDPDNHPIAGDTPWQLCTMGVDAARRRFDVSAVMRIVFAVWFCAMAVAPRPLASWLSEQFAVPASRGWAKRVLAFVPGLGRNATPARSGSAPPSA
jgi:glycosyltransferase involved in cell wall biosynthesis